MRNAPDGKAPVLMVRALRDPDGANLDRIQVIKGWLGADGDTQEKVYNIAWSDNREMDADGKLPLVGNTVDVAQASYSNSIGEPDALRPLARPRLRPRSTRILLRPRARNPDTALDHP